MSALEAGALDSLLGHFGPREDDCEAMARAVVNTYPEVQVVDAALAMANEGLTALVEFSEEHPFWE